MSKNRLCLVVVDVRSAYNIGSLFRTADGFGTEIVLVGITPRPKGLKTDERLPHIVARAHKEISKTALGAEETVYWRYFNDAITAINALREEGFRIVAIEQDPKSKNINMLNPDTPTALVVGSEINGLSKNILKLCDDIYEIPMVGQKESYNVSVSAGIALYEARFG